MATGLTSEPGHRLLLVDDDPEMLGAVRRCLRRPGLRVEATTDPAEAARLLHNGPVDLIISDVDMPGMTGHELMAVARRAVPSAVRVLLTGAPTQESAVRAINEGEVHRFLEKPFDPDRLRALVAEALRRKDELARVSRAGVRAQRRRYLMEALEREHPGITAAPAGSEGVHEVAADRARAIAAALGLPDPL